MSPLSEWVQPPEPSRASLQLEWHEVRRRVKRHRQVRVAGALAAVLVLVAAGAGVALRPVKLEEGQRVVAVRDEQVRLDDGSRLRLAAGATTTLELAQENEVVVLLEQGRVTFEVSKRPTRRFVVKARDVEVRVVGTKFTVDRGAEQVSVEVLEGIVEVRAGDEVKRLTRGASWSSGAEVVPAEAESTPPVDAAPHADVAGQGAEGPGPRADAPSVTPVRRAPKPSPRGAPAEPTVVREAPEAPAEQPAPAPEDPAADFAAAMRARGAGHVKEAIRGFQQVCERFPSSAYAPMSAFEWGRLALDSQDDPRQAARAFERTLELATSASLIEDALARLTEAYARYDVGSCRRVQAEYLRRFPSGPHVRGVTKACP